MSRFCSSPFRDDPPNAAFEFVGENGNQRIATIEVTKVASGKSVTFTGNLVESDPGFEESRFTDASLFVDDIGECDGLGDVSACQAGYRAGAADARAGTFWG